MRIYVAGNRGMVGSAIVRELGRVVPGAQVLVRTHAELDLLNQAQVFDFLATEKPDGTPRKLLDVSRANSLGWKAKVDLEREIGLEHHWFLKNFQ